MKMGLEDVMMKRFVYNLRYLWPMAVFVLGIGFLFGPYIDGWCEIFCPRISHELRVLLLLWRPLAFAAFTVHCIYSIFVLVRRRPLQYKIYIAIPLVLLPLMWGVVYPPGVTYSDRRVSSFKMGGWTRVMWAGGPSKMRREALELIDTSSGTSSPEPEWPASIKALGAIHVRVDREARIVDVAIPPSTPYSDQFGFLIQDVDTPTPTVVGGSEGDEYRIWQLADGIYLYEEW
ncbi:MAG: hypothetical protein SVX38_11380 [Chloroflexota bacterium]|nr:hypothetical protein [Chloroflexota bacterium]